MKKIIFALACAVLPAVLFADDYTATTILSNPVGVFDNLNVSGAATLNNVEIGARAKDPSSPVKQTQSLTVYGNTDLLSSASSGSKIQIGANLYLKGGVQYTFSNVYLYDGSLLYLSSGTSGSLLANQIYAKEINTFNTFTEGSGSTSESTISISSGTPFKVGALKFYDGSNVRTLQSPRGYGSKVTWVTVSGGNTGNTYGPWTFSSSAVSDTCTGNDNTTEFTCPTGLTSSTTCTDARYAVVPAYSSFSNNYYSSVGGVYFSQVRGRSECTYVSSSDSCAMSSYGYTEIGGGTAPANACPFTSSDIASAINGDDIGILCYKLCGDKACTGADTTCKVSDDSINYLESGTTSSGVKQPGVTAALCTRTIWPANSGLECKNAWTEKSVRVLHCGPGSGQEYTAGIYYQYRTVTCGTSGTTKTSPGTFLVADYDHSTSGS